MERTERAVSPVWTVATELTVSKETREILVLLVRREMLVKMPKTDQMVIKVQSEFQAKTMSETKGSKEQRVPQDKKDHLDLLEPRASLEVMVTTALRAIKEGQEETVNQDLLATRE
jgi:hypothetical protein